MPKDNKPLVKVGGAYSESDVHVPNPTDMYRQLNTSGTGSVTDIRDVTPVFDIAKNAAHRQAAAALDPKDESVPRSTVLLPDEKRDNDEAIKDIKARGKEAEKPVEVGSGYKGPNARAAAEETGDEGARGARAQEREQGAPGGATDGGKTTTQPATQTPAAQPATAQHKGDQKS